MMNKTDEELLERGRGLAVAYRVTLTCTTCGHRSPMTPLAIQDLVARVFTIGFRSCHLDDKAAFRAWFDAFQKDPAQYANPAEPTNHEKQLRDLHGVIDALMKQRAESDATIALVLTRIAFELASAIERERHMLSDSRPVLRGAIRDAFNALRAVVDGLEPTTGEVKTGAPS